ncbi:MAG: histidinol-phosphatase HisJ family protein [Ruminococcaceae bacterium]|nr:histidinol-phosphatase HisJ family protein [Oscillospiraceae bacterium]
MRANFHAHTSFSFDGCPEATVDAMCESAIAHGLSLIALTDHCDINGEIEGIYPVLDKEGVFAAVQAAKQKYADRLTVLFGVELGQATQYPAEARALLQKYPYDIVLASLHNLAHTPDFYYMSKPDAEFPAPQLSEMTDSEIGALFSRVLEETMALLDFDGIHVLTHLTYMHRYVRRVGKELDFGSFTPALTALFEKMIRRGVALELNVSTLYREGVTMPTPELIALYRRTGGRLISVGSDAHHPDRVTFSFDRAAEILRDCDFTELAVPTANGILTFPI